MSVLITTATCPMCKQISKILTDKGINFEKRLAEDDMDFVKEHKIMSVPTLCTDDGKIYRGFNEILKWANQTTYNDSICESCQLSFGKGCFLIYQSSCGIREGGYEYEKGN